MEFNTNRAPAVASDGEMFADWPRANERYLLLIRVKKRIWVLFMHDTFQNAGEFQEKSSNMRARGRFVRQEINTRNAGRRDV